MPIKSLEIKIKSSHLIKEYYTVDVMVVSNEVVKEKNELISYSDFESKLEQLLELLKKEVLQEIKERDDEI